MSTLNLLNTRAYPATQPDLHQAGPHHGLSCLTVLNFLLLLLAAWQGGRVINPFLTNPKSRCHAAVSIRFGNKPPLALLVRSLL